MLAGNHWDDVIKKYKEIELNHSDLPEVLNQVIKRVQNILSKEFQELKSCHSTEINFLPVHVIDLHEDGNISSHVDSIKFSGEIVAALSLNSTRVLRLRQHKSETDKDENHAIVPTYEYYVHPRTLYMLTGPMRYEFSHAILGKNDEYHFLTPPSVITRRISLMFRDELASRNE
jgi:alkylated DNA repair protein alkB family protein 7